MLPGERLPPELWLIIFELARGSSTGTRHYCNYLTFPHLSLHLRRPSERTFTIHLWPLTFRLICHYFNSLLKQPSPFFMKNADVAIPADTRALYILPQRDPGPQACFQRLLVDPSICNQITLLNLPGHKGYFQSPPINFDFLCDNAHSLPAVRTLALGVHTPGPRDPAIPRFWWRLNESFPLLTTLVLRGDLVTTYPDTEVVFKHLEVMYWDKADHRATLQLPALRHASFGGIYYYKLNYIADRPHLESLLIRDPEGIRFEWSEFPNLRLLGLPARRTTDVFPPLPPDHPLQHLYVFVGTRTTDHPNQHLFSYEAGLTWLKRTIEHMPTITRVSLWFDKPVYNRINRMSDYFREEDLERLGFTQWNFPYTDYANGYHSILQRVKVEPPPEVDTIASGEPVPQRRGFRIGWNKFVQSTSRRVHL